MKIFASIQRRLILWVWNHTPVCSEMARLASESFDRPIAFGTRFRMRLHHLICVWCKRYATQLKLLRSLAHQSDEHLDVLSGHGLSSEAKDRLKAHLRDNLGN